MKHGNNVVVACLTCVAMLTLAGCGESKQISEVKALAFSYPNSYVQDPNMTVDQALDTRNVCDSVKWSVQQTDRNQTFVEYDCNYKGTSDSAFLARDKTDVHSAGDVYQWTYGTDGQPELSAASFVIRYSNGSAKDFKVNPTALMQLAVNNKVSSFDEAWSELFNTPIPKKPAKDITDTTYGNKLSEIYPNEAPLKAATLAYVWRNASSLTAFGLDSLGYLKLEDSDQAFAVAFPVDPVDVQLAWKIDPSATKVGPEVPDDLHENKLFCLNDRCYDNAGKFVGKTTKDILAKETTAPAYYGKGIGSQLTTKTLGKNIALYMPGKTPLEAIHEALAMIHSTLTVTEVNSDGYPIYHVKCVQNSANPNKECFDDAGKLIGSEEDVAKQMFPVDGRDGNCSDGLVCIGDGNHNDGVIIGGGYSDQAARVLVQSSAPQDANALPPSLGQGLARAQGMPAQPTAQAPASTAGDDLPTGSQDWPTPTPCIKKLEDAYRKDRQAHGLDDTISMDQDNDLASTCKTMGQ